MSDVPPMPDPANLPARSGDPPSRARLWFGMFGGAVAWTVHLIAASITAEWGGFAGLDQWKLLGVTSIVWAIFALSLVLGVAALVSALLAYRAWRRVNEVHAALDDDNDPWDSGTGDSTRLMALAGLVLSGLFLLIIVAQTIPLLFYLRESTQ